MTSEVEPHNLEAERDSLATILNAWPGISGQASNCGPADR